jgi:hypothetical protein
MDSLTLPRRNQLLLLIIPRAKTKAMLDLAAQLALQSPLRVLDGGNQFNVYSVVRTLRQRTLHLTAILKRIQVARAFTCYQMTALLSNSTTQPMPVLVLDLLETFYDENVTFPECRRLLKICTEHLKRLAQNTTVLVSAHPPRSVCAQRVALLDILRAAANTIWEPVDQVNGEENNGTHLAIHYPGIS